MKQAISWRQSLLPFVSVFTSAGTLVCCALPALLVSLGLGATLAGVLTAVPEIVWISENKALVFIAGGVLLFVAGLGQYLNRNAPCPADPELAASCAFIRLISKILLGFSLILYAVGFFFAYLAVYLL
jgi:hypothetical protein